MTVTHVFGFGAREYAEAHGWAGVTLISGNALNSQTGATGRTPETARHIVVTPGTYRDTDFYLGRRAFVTLEGAPEGRPVFIRDGVSIATSREFTLRNIELDDCPVTIASYRIDGPAITLFEDLYQHSFTRSANGFVNPNGQTLLPQDTTFRRVKIDGTGDPGNTKHGIYWEGRPMSRLTFDQFEGYGVRSCSMIKTTCRELYVRNSTLETRSKLDPSVTAGSLIDVPACSLAVVTGNVFDLWRNPDKKAKVTMGLRVPAIHRRMRQKGLKGCDIPAYPDISWSPPESSSKTASSPAPGFSAGPETYVSDEFWREVEVMYDSNPNVYELPAFVSGNLFRMAAGSRAAGVLRDDGTRACEEISQFGMTRMLRTHPNWRERSITYLAQNTYEGEVLPHDMAFAMGTITEVEDGAIHPRTQPYHFPRFREVPLALPHWFKQ